MKTHSLNDWIKAANYYRRKENFEKAVGAFAQARLALLVDMGECFTKMGELENARVLFEEVIEADVRNVRANAGLGIVYLLAGFPEEAALAFGNVLHVDSLQPKALCGLGMARLQVGHFEEGIALLLQSLDQEPDNLAALDELARFAGGTDRECYRPVTVERFRKYLERNPDAIEVRKQMESLSVPETDYANNDNEEITTLIKAFQKDPYQRDLVLALAQQLVEAGCPRDGKDVCGIYLQRYPGDGEVLSLHRSL